jgi:putative FmdB family regulatory protein
MPTYTYRCEGCQGEPFDRPTTIATRNAQSCTTCGQPLTRIFTLGTVIPDEIPGGIEIRHGICHPDGTPRRYYSRSEMMAEGKRRGLVNLVEHQPTRGSDKSPHTTRWI